MTIDPADYEPRPADDFLSMSVAPLPTATNDDDKERLSSLMRGYFDQEPRCPQLGCNFSELPHG